jgi:orotate phosphoribosyltransferase-like protein
MPYDMLAVIRQARKRRKEVLRLRNQGLTLQQIAELWDISRARVHYIVQQAKKEAAGR